MTGLEVAPMLRGMRVALAQVNPTVGDLRGNRQLVEEAAAAASGRQTWWSCPDGPDRLSPMDLLEREGFVRDRCAAGRLE